MRLKELAVVLGMSELWIRRTFQSEGIEPGRWGLARSGTQPFEIDEGAIWGLVLRFLRSRSGIPFAIKSKISYTYLRWAARQQQYVPTEVRRAAELWDPIAWKFSRWGRSEFLVLTKDGKILRTKLLPSEDPSDRSQNLQSQELSTKNDGQVHEGQSTEARRGTPPTAEGPPRR